jgi:hypothetical protein
VLLLIGGCGLLAWTVAGVGQGAAAATKDNYDRIDFGMTPQDVQAVLGPGRQIQLQDFPPEVGPESLTKAARIWAHAPTGQTNLWYQWGPGDPGLYVGFTKAPSGTERVNFVGYRSTVDPRIKDKEGLGYVVKGADLQDEADLRLPPTGPPPGDPSALIIGKWVYHGRLVWEFRADGTYERWVDDLRGPETSYRVDFGTFRLIDQYTVEITDQIAAKRSPKTAVKTFKLVFYAADELRVWAPPAESSLNQKPLLKRGK